MVIINTGGTFNKRYDALKGELIVPQDNRAVESIVSTFAAPIDIAGVIYKDSLEMNDYDRSTLAEAIEESDETCIVVVHGTDTMDLSAQAVAALKLEKVVVFTGAMVPFSVDPVEATANLAFALGFARCASSGVYIAMQGVCGLHTNVTKNRIAGKFEYV